MARFISNRLLSLIPMLLGISIMVFLLLHLLPGDPVRAILGIEADPASIAVLRHQYGLDLPLPLQYLHWLGNVLQGNFGYSIAAHRSVTGLIGDKLAPTVELAIAAMFISLVISIPAGILMAVKRNRWPDYVGTAISLFGVAMPNFWLGLILIFFLSLKLGLLPPSGYVSFSQDPTGNLKHLAMPAITLGVQLTAIVSRMMRSSLLDVLQEPYIQTARSKGLGERVVLGRHAMKVAFLPVVTIVGLQIGGLLGGVVITETIFAWPGIGKLAIDSILAHDFPVLQAIVLLTALTYVLVNLAVDLIYSLLDPRINY